MTFINADTYHYAVVATKLVKAHRVGLALVIRTTLLVGMIENVKVVMINAGKDTGDEFQDGGFSDTMSLQQGWCRAFSPYSLIS